MLYLGLIATSSSQIAIWYPLKLPYKSLLYFKCLTTPLKGEAWPYPLDTKELRFYIQSWVSIHFASQNTSNVELSPHQNMIVAERIVCIASRMHSECEDLSAVEYACKSFTRFVHLSSDAPKAVIQHQWVKTCRSILINSSNRHANNTPICNKLYV
ncbi:hypothetical protein B0O99DRAFT_313837 [Bisporella sp. PMI_857]|nr:hypothetical protein B0O99DRAFT_313837 [Bisporella sp. PMI_857]